MKAYYKGLLISTALIVVFSSLVYWANQEGYFNLKKLEVELAAEKNLKQSEIFQNYKKSVIESVQFLKGVSLLSIDVDDVKANLSSLEWVKAIKIRRVYPDQIQVKVEPKTWLAYYLKDNQFHPYTSQGELLNPVSILQAPDLPMIYLSKKDFELYNDHLIKVLQVLPDEGHFSYQNLQEIALDKEGLYFLVAPDSLKIRLGLEDIDLRIERSERVLKYLSERHLQGRVINADFEKKVVVKLRKAR